MFSTKYNQAICYSIIFLLFHLNKQLYILTKKNKTKEEIINMILCQLQIQNPVCLCSQNCSINIQQPFYKMTDKMFSVINRKQINTQS